jgi:hypothetical protein
MLYKLKYAINKLKYPLKSAKINADNPLILPMTEAHSPPRAPRFLLSSFCVEQWRSKIVRKSMRRQWANDIFFLREKLSFQFQ